MLRSYAPGCGVHEPNEPQAQSSSDYHVYFDAFFFSSAEGLIQHRPPPRWDARRLLILATRFLYAVAHGRRAYRKEA